VSIRTRFNIRHHTHVQQRFEERYSFKLTAYELLDIEDAVNTLDSIYFWPRKRGSGSCDVLFRLKGKLVHAVVSEIGRKTGRRFLLTVLTV